MKQMLPTGDDSGRLPIVSCQIDFWHPSEPVKVIAIAIAIR